MVLTNRNIGVMRLFLSIPWAVCGGEVVAIFFVCECELVGGLYAFKDQANLWGFAILSIKYYHKAHF